MIKYGTESWDTQLIGLDPCEHLLPDAVGLEEKTAIRSGTLCLFVFEEIKVTRVLEITFAFKMYAGEQIYFSSIKLQGLKPCTQDPDDWFKACMDIVKEEN